MDIMVLSPVIKYDMMNGDQLSALRVAANKYSVLGTDEKEGTNTDWQDELYRPSAVTSHDVSVSGGSEKGTYSGGIGYFKR